jgi:hypothetical protein
VFFSRETPKLNGLMLRSYVNKTKPVPVIMRETELDAN